MGILIFFAEYLWVQWIVEKKHTQRETFLRDLQLGMWLINNEK